MRGKQIMEWTKTHSADVMDTMCIRISKPKLIKHAAVIFHPYHVTLFPKTCQNVLFAAGFPEDLSNCLD